MRHSAGWPGSALTALTLVAAMPACGHRGDPLPPLRHTPPGLTEFRLAQRGRELEVSLVAPAASVDGIAYERVVVEILFAEGQKDLEKAGARREIPALPRQRIVETLALPAPGTIARAAARGIVGREKGQRTLTLALIAQPEVAAPTELRARLVSGGVELKWIGEPPEPVDAAVKPPPIPMMPRSPLPGTPPAPSGPPAATGPPGASTQTPAPPQPPAATPATPIAPPAQAATPAPAGQTPLGAEGVATTVQLRKAGFFVYRRVGTESYRLPLGPQPLADRRSTDAAAPEGGKACYVVRAVASADPLVESAPSNEACVDVRDIEPPAAPGGLAVLPRDKGLEVLWTPSVEADLLGYRVYRESASEPRRKLADVEAGRSSWLDTSASRGVDYRYTVTAVDRAGNESPEAPLVEASLP